MTSEISAVRSQMVTVAVVMVVNALGNIIPREFLFPSK
jgi:hypothetical protein